MGLYRAEGVVLCNRDLGEADRIVTLLCREQGKLEAVARGARRPRNRLVGLTLPFNVLRMSLFASRGLDQLSQAEAIRSFPAFYDDLVKLAYASYLAELTREFLPEHEPYEAVYDLLVWVLTGIEAGREPEGLVHLFALRLLDLTGFRPALESCLVCGRPPENEALFASAAGGFYCRACVPPLETNTLPVTGQALAAMARGLAGDEDFFAPLTANERCAVRRIVHAFLEARLDRELKSLRFLNGVLGS